MKVKNKQVVFLSIIALACVVLTFVFKEWLFLIPAVIIMLINQKKLTKQDNKDNSSESTNSKTPN